MLHCTNNPAQGYITDGKSSSLQDAVSTTQNPSITNLNQDLGTCLCDLTRNACDTNCCCDSDCSANEIDSFFKGGCLAPNNGNSSAIPYCSKQLLLINARSDAASIIVTKDTNAALCVVTSNSPIKGTFYVDPSTFTTQSSFLARYSLSEFPVEDEAYNVENGFSKSVASYRV